MRKQPFGRLTIVIATTIFWIDSSAYEVNVHEGMTENAFNATFADSNEQLFQRLGIKADRFFRDLVFRRNALDWMKEGSKSEDSLHRPLHHFYDPISGQGLNGNALLAAFCPGGTCTPSLDWAQNVNADNQNDVYSIPAAREWFYRALTTSDPLVRERHWAGTFRAVGQIVHSSERLNGRGGGWPLRGPRATVWRVRYPRLAAARCA